MQSSAAANRIFRNPEDVRGRGIHPIYVQIYR